MIQKIIAIIVATFFVVVYMMHPTSATVNQDLLGKVIILDPGHGEESPNVWKDYYEHIAMLDLALKIKPLLEARGARVLLTRQTENDVSLAARCAMINIWALRELADEGRYDIAEIGRLINIMQSIISDPETNAPIYFNTPFDYTYERQIHPDLERIFELQNDPLISERFLMVSLHSNATGRPVNTSRNGVDIFYMSNDVERNENYYANYSNVGRSYYLANLLIDDISRLGLAKNRVRDNYYFMIREHNVPAVLVENGFHTNDGDRAKLMDDDFLNRLASAYDKTILFYFATSDMGNIPARLPMGDLFGSL